MRLLLLITTLCVSTCVSAQPRPQPTKLPTLPEFQAFVRAADAQRDAAEARIRDLQGQIMAYEVAEFNASALAEYDKQTLDSLKSELAVAVSQKQAAEGTIARLTALLPRRYRKGLDGKPDALVLAFETYLDDLKGRAWKTLIVGAVGGIAGMLAIFL